MKLSRLNKFSIAFVLLASVAARADHEITSGKKTEGRLGMGYSSKQEKFKSGDCLVVNRIEEGKEEAHVAFDQKVSRAQLEKELGIEVGGRARFGAVEYTASSKFAQSSASNEYSISLTYSGNYRFANAQMQNVKPSELGERLLKSGKFEETCGDELVWQVEQGANLFFNIRINFSSIDDKRLFENKFSANGSLAEAHASMKEASHSFKQEASVNVSAYQVGGDVAMVSQIFTGNKADTSAEALEFEKCSLGDFSKCDAVLARAVDYATNTTTGFASQMKKDDKGVRAKSSPITYLAVPYSQVGVYPKYGPGIKEAAIVARQKLADYFEDALAFQTQADYLLNKGIVDVSPSQKAELAKAVEINENNIRRMVDASQICYDDYGKCFDVVSALTPTRADGLKVIDKSLLDVRLETFKQFCAAAYAPQADSDLQDTIRVLLAHAKKLDPTRFTAAMTPSVQCDNARLVFQAQESLVIRSAGLKSLAPLAEFTQLRSLDVRHNEIVDLTPLSGMNQLETLDVSYNLVSEVDGIAQNPKLANADLSYNVIRDAAPLASAKNLSRLDIRGNLPTVTCPQAPRMASCAVKPLGLMAEFASLGPAGSKFSYLPVSVRFDNGTYLIRTNGSFVTFNPQNQSFTLQRNDDGVEILSELTLLQNGKVLLSGGRFEAETQLKIYDPASTVIEILAVKMSHGRVGHTATRLKNGKVLLAGGHGGQLSIIRTNPDDNSSSFAYTADIFDPDKLTIKTVTMKMARADHTATELADGRVLLVGGTSSDRTLATAELFDPETETFSEVANVLRDTRAAHSATKLENGSVLIAGGGTITGAGESVSANALDTAELFDPKTNRFRPLAGHMRTARGAHSATLLSNGDVLFAGGSSYEASGILDSVEVFKLNEESFGEIPSRMVHPRSAHVALPFGANNVVFVGGTGMPATDEAELMTLTNLRREPEAPNSVPGSRKK